MASPHPYYSGRTPAPQREQDFAGHGLFVDLTKVRLPFYPDPATAVRQAQAGFDGRAAAYVRACVAPDGTYLADPQHPDDLRKGTWWGPVQVRPTVTQEDVDELAQSGAPEATISQPRDLLELKWYGSRAPEVHLVLPKCLAALAYRDYFPGTERTELNAMASQAVLAAGPGWCGTVGPGISDSEDLLVGKKSEGNYDMNQMHLVAMAYRYYDKLYDSAREHLITVLLARGRIHRVTVDDTFTSGGAPVDWSRAGYALPHKRIGETENHQMTMMTARYLTNQLLYQREPILPWDNRRNDPTTVGIYAWLVLDGQDPRQATVRIAQSYPTAAPTGGSCTAILLSLLQSFLRDDFSEYNAKNYQIETRWALLNLCSYAYDHEVRLAARMVLDYVAAHMAVSSCDLRRLLPFRRRNEGGKSAHDARGFLSVPLLDSNDADPMAPFFALSAGNVRAYERDTEDEDGVHHVHVAVAGGDQLLDALGDYRLPAPIHDLFVADPRRRFFQRLHRTEIEEDWIANPHNADNMELFAGSPSYLLTAGGEGARFAIDPRFAGFVVGDQDQQLGVAVTTTFLPTVRALGTDGWDVSPRAASAADLIQFSSFSAGPVNFISGGARNYGVGPDFLCGHQVRVPDWYKRMGGVLRPDGTPAYEQIGGFTFLDKGSSLDGSGAADGPGFYLALYQRNGPACLEALDTWLDPGVSFNQFKDVVFSNNVPVENGGSFDLVDGKPARWTTYRGTRLRFQVSGAVFPNAIGAEVLDVEEYSPTDPLSARGDAGNRKDRFLSGTVLDSPADGIVTIANPLLDATITLDMLDHLHPRRTSETGEVEVAGAGGEVWADFDWQGAHRGDVCQPYGTLAEAMANVAPGGTIRIAPSTSPERIALGAGKAMRLLAPIGGVRIG